MAGPTYGISSAKPYQAPNATAYVLPSGKIPSEPRTHSISARARAHDQAEQQLAADVAEQRAPGRASGSRRPACRRPAARRRARPRRCGRRRSACRPQRTMIRISAKRGLDERAARASRVKLTTSPAPPVMRSPIVCSAVSPSCLTCDVDAVAVEPVLQVGERRCWRRRRSPGRRRWKPETWSEIGLASRKPTPDERPRPGAIITIATAAPRGMRARCSSATNGFSSSAISPAMMNSSRTGPAALQQQVGADDRRAAAGPAGPSAGRATGATRARRRRRAARRSGGESGPASPTSSSGFAASSSVCRDIDCDDSVRAITAILFIGDVVGRAGRRRHARAAARPARGARARLRRRQRRERRRRPRDHAQGGRRAVRAPAPTRSRSATTPTATARSGPTSSEERRIIRPYNFLRTPAGPRDDDGRARRRRRSASSTSAGMVHLQAGAPPLVAIDEALREVARRRPRPRRHARRGRRARRSRSAGTSTAR